MPMWKIGNYVYATENQQVTSEIWKIFAALLVSSKWVFKSLEKTLNFKVVSDLAFLKWLSEKLREPRG